LFDESLRQAEDLDMSFRVGQHSQFANLDVVVLYCRYHKESVSAKTIKVNIRDSLLVRDRYQKSNKYSWSYVDSLAYYFTYFSQFLPAKFILKLFELLR